MASRESLTAGASFCGVCWLSSKAAQSPARFGVPASLCAITGPHATSTSGTRNAQLADGELGKSIYSGETIRTGFVSNALQLASTRRKITFLNGGFYDEIPCRSLSIHAHFRDGSSYARYSARTNIQSGKVRHQGRWRHGLHYR